MLVVVLYPLQLGPEAIRELIEFWGMLVLHTDVHWRDEASWEHHEREEREGRDFPMYTKTA